MYNKISHGTLVAFEVWKCTAFKKHLNGSKLDVYSIFSLDCVSTGHWLNIGKSVCLWCCWVLTLWARNTSYDATQNVAYFPDIRQATENTVVPDSRPFSPLQQVMTSNDVYKRTWWHLLSVFLIQVKSAQCHFGWENLRWKLCFGSLMKLWRTQQSFFGL